MACDNHKLSQLNFMCNLWCVSINAVHGSVYPRFGGLDVSNPRFKLNELLSVQLSVQTDVLVREVV